MGHKPDTDSEQYEKEYGIRERNRYENYDETDGNRNDFCDNIWKNIVYDVNPSVYSDVDNIIHLPRTDSLRTIVVKIEIFSKKLTRKIVFNAFHYPNP